MLTKTILIQKAEKLLPKHCSVFFKDSFSYTELCYLCEISECERGVSLYGGGASFPHSFMLACGGLSSGSFAQILSEGG